MNSPFGSNIPPLQTIPYANLDTPAVPYPHLIQPLSIHTSSAPQESSPMMSLEDCKKLAIEVQSTAFKLEGASGTQTPTAPPSLTATGV